MIKVVKFGGSSVSGAKQFEKVKNIVDSDPARKFIVTSACGKAGNEDHKVTDLLYLCHAHIRYGVAYDNLFDLIVRKYQSIKEELHLQLDLELEFEDINNIMKNDPTTDYLVSRGEYLTGKLLAEYLDADFLDAKDLIRFSYNGKIDFEKSGELLEKYAMRDRKVVIPGFYGSLPNGVIKVMSRGGSDVTGAIIANLVDADVYENWTDVSGILAADPRIVKAPRRIDHIRYDVLRELSYMSANVLHDESIFPVKEKGIPINIRNTNDPANEGTMIMADCSEYDAIDPPGFITGVSGKKNFMIITCTGNHFSSEVGTLRKALGIFEDFQISVESVPAGIDTFSIIVESSRIENHLYEVLVRLKDELHCDRVSYIDKISLIAVVGRGMSHKPGMSGKLFAKLGLENINIRTINQGADEIDIIIGVDNTDFEKTICCIYENFLREK